MERGKEKMVILDPEAGTIHRRWRFLCREKAVLYKTVTHSLPESLLKKKERRRKTLAFPFLLSSSIQPMLPLADFFWKAEGKGAWEMSFPEIQSRIGKGRSGSKRKQKCYLHYGLNKLRGVFLKEIWK